MKRLAAVAVLTALAFPHQDAFAQFAPGARSVGMGGGGMVHASGVDAVELNPANLAAGVGWSVSVFELGGSSLSTGATFSEIVAIMGGDFLGSADVNVSQVINAMGDGGIGLSLVSEGYTTAFAADQSAIPQPGSPPPSFGVTVGQFGFRVRSRVFLDVTLGKDLADLIGNGFTESRIQEYSVGNTGFRELSVSEITASYGATLGGLLAVGVGARYVKGHQMTDGRFFEPVLDLASSPQTLTVPSVAVEATGGSGFGIDLGVSLELPNGLRVSASGTNVLQRMNWNDPLVSHSASFTDVDFDTTDFVDLLGRYDSQPVDPSSVSLPVFQVSQNLFEESYYPAVFRGGVGFERGGTAIELSGVSVAPRGRYRSAWDERISLGIEQEVPVVTFRAGIARAQDGVQALTGGLGFRIGPVHLDTSGGRFSGDSEDAGTYDGYYATFSLQLRGGGS